MNIKYLLGAILSIPLLPLLYFQGRQILKSVPKLPEAKGPEGRCRQAGDLEKKTLQVIAIGESTIAGVGVENHEEGFAGTFAREISQRFNQDVNWRVYARNGYTARKVERKLIPFIEEKQADLIIIGLGGNDAFTLNRPSKWREDCMKLIETLVYKFPSAIIVFCNMPPIKEFPAFTKLVKFTVGNLVEILGEELEALVSDYENVFYFGEKITLLAWIEKYGLDSERADFFSDGVHPSKLTYQTWAKDIADKVTKNEKIKNILKK